MDDEFKERIGVEPADREAFRDIKPATEDHDRKSDTDMSHVDDTDVIRVAEQKDGWIDVWLKNVQAGGKFGQFESMGGSCGIGFPGFSGINLDHVVEEAINRVSERLKQLGRYIGEKLGLRDRESRPRGKPGQGAHVAWVTG